MAMGGYDHAMKTMRKQARAAREARERSRERRSGGVWVEHDAIRTPRDATCITCGTPQGPGAPGAERGRLWRHAWTALVAVGVGSVTGVVPGLVVWIAVG